MSVFKELYELYYYAGMGLDENGRVRRPATNKELIMLKVRLEEVIPVLKFTKDFRTADAYTLDIERIDQYLRNRNRKFIC